MAARATLKKFFPVDVIPVVVPVAFAGVLFSWMMTRTIVSDPDSHISARSGVAGLDESTKHAEARGDGWRSSIRNHFKARIDAGATSVFPNKV